MKKIKSIKRKEYPKAQTGLEIPIIMNLISSFTKGKGEGGGDQKLPFKDLLSRLGDSMKSVVYPLTGLSTIFANAQNARDEQRRYVESIQPRSQYNTNESGVNNIPAYFKKGGRRYSKYQVGALAGLSAGTASGTGAGAAAGFDLSGILSGFQNKKTTPAENSKNNQTLMMIQNDPILKELMRYLQMQQGGFIDHSLSWDDLMKRDTAMQMSLNPNTAFTNASEYFMKSGGQTSNDKARKILRDGKVNGKKLTPKQRRFFGAMTNMQTGGTPTTDLRSEWNTYVDWLQAQNMKGNPELDKNQLGFKYLDDYRKQNPNSILTKESVPEIQKYLQDYRKWVIENHKTGKRPVKFTVDPGPNYELFMSNLSQVDGYPGQYTTSYKFPSEYLNSVQQGFADMAKQKKQEGGYVLDDIVDLQPDQIKELQKLGYQFEFVED